MLTRFELKQGGAGAIELEGLIDGGTPDANAGRTVWVKVARVTVPPRTTRKTVIEKALEIAPCFAPASEDIERFYRVLDADSADEIPGVIEAVAPRVVIG